MNGKFLVVTFDEHGPADGNYSKLCVRVNAIAVMLMRLERSND